MRYLMTAAPLVLAAAASLAQEPAASAPAPDLEALNSCVALAGSGKAREAAVQGKVALAMYQQRLAANPRDVEALIGAARAMSQCIVPSAGLMEQGALTSEAMELLDTAIEIEPENWMARFILASIADRSPAFLGRGKRAAKEYDELLRIQGDRNDDPLFALVFAARGHQLSRQGQVDSARALWTRGARLFPNDPVLKGLAGSSASPDTTVGGPASESRDGEPASESDAPADATSPPTRDSAPVLATVAVVASTAPKVTLPAVKSVSRSEVLMTAGGTADVLQAVQLQPGATRVTEGADIHTRGGDAAETALIVNGGRLIGLGRFEGLNGSLFGTIEPFVVKSVRYSSGGFSVRHGNALSGVLEIETDGRPRERQTRAGLSLVQASGTFRAPTGARAGSWVSARVSRTGALLSIHGRSDEFDGAPHSEEVVGSFVINPTQLTEARVTGVVERDASTRYVTAAGWRGGFESNGETRALLLSSRWISSSRPVVMRGTVAAATRSNGWKFGVLARDREESSLTTRVDAEWERNPGTMIRAGLEHGLHGRVESGTVPTTQSVAPDAPARALDESRSSADRIGAYGETEFTHGATSMTAGIRVDRLPGESELTIDPRLAVSTRFGEWTARVSGGIFSQGRWRGDPAIPDAGTPSGLPRSARHGVVGLERSMNDVFVRAEAYVKRYADYRAFGTGPEITGGTARGLDLIAQQTTGPVTGFLGYSLIDASWRLADGHRVRSAFDATHSATASVTAAVATDWSLGTTARYGTGTPRTPITGGTTAADGRTEPVHGTLMSERLPAYARVDARVMRYVRAPSFLMTAFVEILNVAGRRNVSAFAYDPMYTSREPVHAFFSRRTLVMGSEFLFR